VSGFPVSCGMGDAKLYPLGGGNLHRRHDRARCILLGVEGRFAALDMRGYEIPPQGYVGWNVWWF